MEDILQKIHDGKIKKLTDVGFTKEQAEVLVDMIKSSGLMWGMF